MKRCFSNHDHWQSPSEVNKDLQLQSQRFRYKIAKVIERGIAGNYLQCGWRNTDGSISWEDQICAVSTRPSKTSNIKTLKGMINNHFYLFLVYHFGAKLSKPTCACFSSMRKGMLRMKRFVSKAFSDLIEELKRNCKYMFVGNLALRRQLMTLLDGLTEYNAFIELENILDLVNTKLEVLQSKFNNLIQKFYSTELFLQGDESDGTFKHTEYIALFDLMKKQKLKSISHFMIISYKDICNTCTLGFSLIVYFKAVDALTFHSCKSSHFFNEGVRRIEESELVKIMIK